jgi:ubiquinone/menaquinone biosynthesis C-methylase UbiE
MLKSRRKKIYPAAYDDFVWKYFPDSGKFRNMDNKMPEKEIPLSGEVHADRAKQAWQSAESAARYRESRNLINNSRSRREDAIITEWLRRLPPKAHVLDLPCGTGRMIDNITKLGLQYTGGDISPHMIEIARKEAAGNPNVVRFLEADLEKLPFEDNAFDCIIIWRILHHQADPQIRQRMLAEAARVTRRWVLVSFHHLLSATAFRKFIQRTCFGRQQNGRPITHWRLRREAVRSGLRLVETKGLRKYASINWYACFEKIDRT